MSEADGPSQRESSPREGSDVSGFGRPSGGRDIPSRLRMEIASRLESHAEAITDRWLQELEARLGVRPTRLLPREELRDHVPDLLRGLGSVLRLPGTGPPSSSIDHLRLLAELRREQGYDVQEILREFDILSQIVFDEAAGWLEETGATASEATAVCSSLRAALGQIGVVTVDAYQEEHLREKRQVSERLAEFANTLEHEVGDALQAVASSVEMLRREGLGEEGDEDVRQQYAATAEKQLQRVRKLVSDVRQLAVAQDASTDATRQPLREVIRSVFREVGDLAERAEVSVELVEPLPEIYVDRSRVAIALMNLVTNGIKYADPEEDERWVRVSVHEEAQEDAEPEWHLVVEDNGLGVPDGLGNQIFRRFVRVHSEAAPGTGLGLAIVRRVMEQRGGRVFYESEEGEGSTFTAVIPPRLGAREWKETEVES